MCSFNVVQLPLTSIPLFPLGLLPLPGERLALHIFEPRYQRLFHALEHNEVEEIGIAYHTPSNPHSFELTTNTSVTRVSDPKIAVAGAHVVYTDTWVSMGEGTTHKPDRLLSRFLPYQVTAELMALADPSAIFMHCLPAHRGEEVTDDVIEAPYSKVFDQAENRLHAQKAVMCYLVAS